MIKRQKGEAVMIVMMTIMIIAWLLSGHGHMGMGPMGMHGQVQQDASQQESKQDAPKPQNAQ